MKEKLKNFLYLFAFSLLIWLALTSNFNYQKLAIGVLISLAVSVFLNNNYLKLGLPSFSLNRLAFFIIYLFILFKEIIKANIDVAYRIIHPAMPIKPGIVVIKTRLKSDIAKMILANSITLTPGTFTLDILEDKLLVHWINVKTEDIDEATKIIGEKFEKYLKVIFA